MTSFAEPGKKSLVLNAFVEMCSGHQSPGLWRHPDDQSWRFNEISHWVELAKLLEEAKFHGIFIADVLGGYDVYQGSLDAAITSGAQWPVNEPLAAVSAMAAVTKSIGFGVTVSTTYEQPYHLARRLSTADHLSGGRLSPATWIQQPGTWDAQNSHSTTTATPKPRSTCASCTSSSSPPGATTPSSATRPAGVYTDPKLVRRIDHAGLFFTVPGPHLCQPSPQRTPLILQAGTSKSGKQFAAQHAEAVFVSAHAPVVCAGSIAEIRQAAAAQFGRDGAAIKVLALVTPILGTTEAEAQQKLAEYRKYASHDGALALFGGWTGIDLSRYGDEEELREVESNAVRSTVTGYAKFSPGTKKWTKHTIADHVSIGGNGPVLVGTPSQVADGLQTWVDEADVDGFNFAYALFPQSFKDIIELLLPELRRRGLFWDDYAVPSGTYRENLYREPGLKRSPPDHVSAKFRWQAGGFGRGSSRAPVNVRVRNRVWHYISR
ncbi:Nitrilotriacetate monooxygenase component A/pristinamycin IIA synthase subunit A [Apiospora hydei]|uniref:Nitrilotriacetate monooxygenase component A/pristinamycin IIA synthase subunit A n=1 Tax=Apiospora hydei TaxID=1337664 RepID=A0ABR1WDU6_9PEZI